MKNRKSYFYICEDCGEAIPQRLDVILSLQNFRCRTCSNRRKGKENRDKISKTITEQWKQIPIEERKRITNEIFLKPEIIEKRSKIVKQGYASGRLKAWNEGNHTCLNTGRTHIKKGQRLSPKTEYKPGKDHYLWKGGIGLVRGLNWDKIRKKIYKRDDFKCQYCGKKGKLNCHHIIPYRSTQDNSGDNLITLCNLCHSKLERMYDNMITRAEYFSIINKWKIYDTRKDFINW
jgi:5-methylcytosine-specific restriction endonuclease McrA